MKELLAATLILALVACKSNDNPNVDTDQETENTNESKVESGVEDTMLTDPRSIDGRAMIDAFFDREEQFDFYAVFTEPFMTVYLKDDLAIFERADAPLAVYRCQPQFDTEAKKQEITFGNDSIQWKLDIIYGSGSDGMSEIDYPYSVILNNECYGGGAESFQNENLNQ